MVQFIFLALLLGFSHPDTQPKSQKLVNSFSFSGETNALRCQSSLYSYSAECTLRKVGHCIANIDQSKGYNSLQKEVHCTVEEREKWVKFLSELTDKFSLGDNSLKTDQKMIVFKTWNGYTNQFCTQLSELYLVPKTASLAYETCLLHSTARRAHQVEAMLKIQDN